MCNDFLREVGRFYKCANLRIDSNGSVKSTKKIGLFIADSTVGMLEGRHYQNLEKVLPFIGLICDSLCNDSSLSCTNVFVSYFDMIHTLYRVGKHKYWMNEDEVLLDDQNAKFKNNLFLFSSQTRSRVLVF